MGNDPVLDHSDSGFLILSQKVAAAANASSDLTQVIRITLDGVRDLTHWPIGHAYFVREGENGHFASSNVWSVDQSEPFQGFQDATKEIHLSLSAGLPGRILAGRKPIWMMDLANPATFPRAPYALKAGLRHGFGFPVFVDQEIVAIMEFFSREEMVPSPEFETLMSQIGIQLGRAFERERAVNSLRQSEARYRALAETASDAILTIDESGTILYVNPATTRMFGYSTSELLFQNIVILMPEYLKDLHRAALANYVRTGIKHMNWHQIALSGLKSDGKEIPIELSLAEFVQDGNQLFTGIIRDITERKRAEEALQQLSANVLRLQDEERRKIARELHDSTGQYLAAISMILEAPEQDLASTEAKQQLAEVRQLVVQCSREVRTLSHLLHPPLLDEMGLGSAIPWFTEGFAKRSGVRIELELPAKLERLPPESELVIFRLLQEGLTNIHRHSSSEVAKIRLSLSEGLVILEIQDNGKGIEPQHQVGVGIAGMRERVKQLKGSFEIESNSRGTLVRARLPLRSDK